MPRTTEAHAGEVRRRILDGARRVMEAGGYGAANMQAIASEAGVSVGLIYRYFPSKEELELEVCEAVTQSHLDALAAELAQITDPDARLGAAVRLYVRSLVDEDWGGIVTGALAVTGRAPRVRELLRRRCDQIRAFAAMFIREAVARGDVDPATDVESLSLAATLLLDGAIVHQAELGEALDADAVERAIIELLRQPMQGRHR